MKRWIISFLSVLVFFGFLLSGLPVKAVTIAIENPLKYNTFGELINNLINFIFSVALVIAPMMIIIAGFYFLTAMGDVNKIQQAKNIIWWTIIGFIIILLAKGLVAVLGEIIGVKIIGGLNFFFFQRIINKKVEDKLKKIKIINKR